MFAVLVFEQIEETCYVERICIYVQQYLLR